MLRWAVSLAALAILTGKQNEEYKIPAKSGYQEDLEEALEPKMTRGGERRIREKIEALSTRQLWRVRREKIFLKMSEMGAPAHGRDGKTKLLILT